MKDPHSHKLGMQPDVVQRHSYGNKSGFKPQPGIYQVSNVGISVNLPKPQFTHSVK